MAYPCARNIVLKISQNMFLAGILIHISSFIQATYRQGKQEKIGFPSFEIDPSF